MKKALLCLVASLAFITSFSQSRVFKEVSDGISTQVSSILQDNTVVGYLIFSRLEKVTDDRYNYRITIMDENLNDIGTLNFQDQGLSLRGIAFEQDILCLAYFKSDMIDKSFSRARRNPSTDGFKHFVKMQFLGLDGKIIDSVVNPVSIDIKVETTVNAKVPKGDLTMPLQLVNIPGHGFACFYGDNKKNYLLAYSPSGKRLWHRVIKEEPLKSTRMIPYGQDLFILAEGKGNKEIKKHYIANSYELLSFNFKDSSASSRAVIKDKKEHQLGIMDFSNDPSTGKPYISGYIRSTKKNARNTVNGIARGHYAGVFSYDIAGTDKKDLKEIYTYWDQPSSSPVSPKGYVEEEKCYPLLNSSFRDFDGNTYFTADGIKRRWSPNRTFTAIYCAPLIPFSFATGTPAGTRQSRIVQPLLIKQNAKGEVSCSSPFKGNKHPVGYVMDDHLPRKYNTVSKPEQKQQYMVVQDISVVTIYNITTQKVVREIPLFEKNIRRAVFKAKEGHVLISEYNSKEKSTRISIEAL